MAKTKLKLKEPHGKQEHNEEISNGMYMDFDEAMRKISKVTPPAPVKGSVVSQDIIKKP